MQDTQIRIDATQIPEQQMRSLCEGAYEILQQLKSTKEGRKMLREEIALMRKEREAAKC